MVDSGDHLVCREFWDDPGRATRTDIRNTIQCPLCRRLPLQDCKSNNGANHRERYDAFMKALIPGWKSR